MYRVARAARVIPKLGMGGISRGDARVSPNDPQAQDGRHMWAGPRTAPAGFCVAMRGAEVR